MPTPLPHLASLPRRAACGRLSWACALLSDLRPCWGVDVVFGLPGDGINGSPAKEAGPVRFIQVRHEEAAAFMACAYAKHTGLYDARLDGQPVNNPDIEPQLSVRSQHAIR